MNQNKAEAKLQYLIEKLAEATSSFTKSLTEDQSPEIVDRHKADMQNLLHEIRILKGQPSPGDSRQSK